MNILHLITLGAAAFNVVRKVLGKRDLASTIYGDRISSIDSYKLYRKYHINMQRKFLAIIMGEKVLYSFLTVYVPDVIVKRKGLPDGDYYFDVAAAAQKAILEDKFGNNRFGRYHDLMLVDSIPDNVMTPCRKRKGYKRIKDEFSVYQLAHRVGGRPQLRGLLLDVVKFIYNKSVLDGVVPRDCVAGLD